MNPCQLLHLWPLLELRSFPHCYSLAHLASYLHLPERFPGNFIFAYFIILHMTPNYKILLSAPYG